MVQVQWLSMLYRYYNTYDSKVKTDTWIHGWYGLLYALVI